MSWVQHQGHEGRVGGTLALLLSREGRPLLQRPPEAVRDGRSSGQQLQQFEGRLAHIRVLGQIREEEQHRVDVRLSDGRQH